MAALADEQTKRHFVMAAAAVFALENLFHGDIVGAALGDEDSRMAIAACEPLGMSQVGKAYMRHLLGIGKDDVQIHLLMDLPPAIVVPIDAASRRDHTTAQGPYPVHLTPAVLGKLGHGFLRVLQLNNGRIGRIMDAIGGQWCHRRGMLGFRGAHG